MATMTDSTEQATEVKVPTSTLPLDGHFRTRKVKGVEVEYATCRFCAEEQPADADHFFPHKASGRLHLRSRCRTCEKTYRTEAREMAAAGNRVVKSRGGNGAKVKRERITVTLDGSQDVVRDYGDRGPVPYVEPAPKPRRSRGRKAS